MGLPFKSSEPFVSIQLPCINREKVQHIQRVKVILTLSPKNKSLVKPICENLHFNRSFSLESHRACLVFIASEKSQKKES